MLVLIGLLKFVMLLLVTLIPVAIWQQTRIGGFLLLAASFAFGALSEGIVPLLFSRIDPGSIETVMLGFRLLSLLMTGVAAAGLWQIYTKLRRPRAAASTGEA